MFLKFILFSQLISLIKCLIVIVSRHAWPYNENMSPKQPITLHEAPSFTELQHWFTHVFHTGKSTVT